MGGELTVSSEVGKGSTFSFELPVSLGEATAVSTHQGIKPSTQPEATPTESVPLRRETLAVLQTHWLAEFHQATTEGDFDWMLALIEQIRTQYGTHRQGFGIFSCSASVRAVVSFDKTGNKNEPEANFLVSGQYSCR